MVHGARFSTSQHIKDISLLAHNFLIKKYRKIGFDHILQVYTFLSQIDFILDISKNSTSTSNNNKYQRKLLHHVHSFNFKKNQS